jgi:hypothetical protein
VSGETLYNGWISCGTIAQGIDVEADRAALEAVPVDGSVENSCWFTNAPWKKILAVMHLTCLMWNPGDLSPEISAIPDLLAQARDWHTPSSISLP